MKVKKNNIMNVLWIAPYPIEAAKSNSQILSSHAAPWITSLAEGVKNDISLTIISFSNKIEKNISFTNLGIHFFFIKIPHPIFEFPLLFKGTLLALKRFSKNFSYEEFDLIHIHGTEHQYATAVKNIQIPKVISIQGLLHKTYKFNNSLNYNFFSWRILKRTEIREIENNKNFICRTHWDMKNIARLNKEPVIHENWELLRPEFFIDAFNYTSYNLVYIGGLVQIKGINEMLLAFKTIIGVNSKYSLTICGHGNTKKLQRLLKINGLLDFKDKISFLGKLNAKELVKLYKKSFCLIHPTYIDNSPNSVCEAQVSGLPVIASDVGGVSSLIKHKESGILVQRYQYREIAESVLLLKNNKYLYFLISKNGRRIARLRHAPESIIENTLSIYQKIIML